MNAISMHDFRRENALVLEDGTPLALGAVLAQARERCALTIEQVANITRVSVRYLRAIEADHYDIIPSAIYIKGFVKAFARAVGVCERWALDSVKAALEKR